MNLIKGAFPYFTLPFVIACLFVPICKWIGFQLGVYAVESSRTVHSGKIVRIGGVAIFVAFYAALAILWKVDATLNGILIGSLFVFFGGLLDDVFDLPPKIKFLFQIMGAVSAIVLGDLNLPSIHIMNFAIRNQILTWIFCLVWIVGVTNAINFIDGLDGLSSGICIIVCSTIGILGFLMGRRDICILCLVLCGSILGFLPYNFHPASIFVGDCGAQFMGYLLACISLLGFKSTAIITLGLPILVLFIPIGDTIIAMIRRKLSGKKMTEADRGHLHHVLMFQLKLGHRKTVLVLYIVTTLFALSAIVTYLDLQYGMVMIIFLLFCFDLFIEKTGMIKATWHPLLSLFEKIKGK